MNCYLWVLITLISLLLHGCGGGSSTSSVAESSPANQSSPSSQTQSVIINPLLDLGLRKGDNVCFRIKAYNNVTESDFSGAICSIVKNEDALNLSWNDVPGNVVGYHVYYGTNKRNASNFIKNILES